MSARALVLLAVAAVTVAGYGVPLAFAPLAWARALGWWLPDDVRLVRYLGRSLGALICALAATVAWLALHPALEAAAAGVTALGFGLVALPHFVGLLERAQPCFETVEGFAFLGLAALFAWLAAT